MHVRITTITGATDIDAGIALAREQSVPALQKLKGYRGLTASADRASGTVAVLTQWETEDDLNASEADAEKLRAEAVRAFGGEPTVARFEQVLAEMPAGPPPLVPRSSFDRSRWTRHSWTNPWPRSSPPCSPRSRHSQAS